MKYDIKEYCSKYCFIDSLLEELVDKNADYHCISVIGKIDLIEFLLKTCSSTSINDMEFSYGYLDFDRYDYKDEYAILLVREENKLIINVEKALQDGEPASFEGGSIYVSDECNSKIIIKQYKVSNEVTAFSIGNAE